MNLPSCFRWAPALALSGLVAAGAAIAETAPPGSAPQLAPERARIADSVIQRDHATFEAVQARIKAVNDRGRPLRDYHLAKAQCWLDVSFHEYTRNDRSAFPQDALTESDRLIALLEAAPGTEPLNGPWETPLVNGAARLRPDLWAQAAGLREHRGFACAAAGVACAEVELVHAGNEHNQQQWRHAKPYVQIAEDRLAEAAVQAERCLPPPAPPPAPVVVVPPVALPPELRVVLSAQLLFDFDRHGAGDIRPFSRDQLDALLQRLRADALEVTSVRLVGHADRLNSTGVATYNDTLAQRRVATVQQLMVAQGIDPARIQTAAVGAQRPVAECEARFRSAVELQECLLPNRRVEVIIEGVRKP